MTPKSLFAVLAGSGVGIVAAVGFRGRTSEADPPSLAPAAARPLESPSETRALVTAPQARDERAAADVAVVTAPAQPAPSAAPQAPAAPSAPPAPEDDVPIATKEEFEAAAIACDEKDAGACRRAAAAAELGAVVQKDVGRAKTFRKVELTVIVRGCEKGAVASCLTLADRYLRGDGVARSERTATALIEHTKELCSRRHDDACRNVPSN
jgi:hypothetical protein